MTNDERLKIAEEIVRFTFPIKLRDMHLTVYGDSGGSMYIAWDGKTKITEDRDAFRCVMLARQKLAAEREAAMSPNERKYRAALEQIVSRCGHQHESKPCVVSSDIAREALKETP